MYCRAKRGDSPIRQSREREGGLKRGEQGKEMKEGGRGDKDEKGGDSVEVSGEARERR